MTCDKRDKRISYLDNRGLLTFFMDKGGIAWTDISNGLMHISAEVGMVPDIFEIVLNGSDYVQYESTVHVNKYCNVYIRGGE